MKRIEPQRHHWIFISLGVLAVALIAWVIFHRGAKPPAAPPAIPVSAVKAQRQDIPMSITALGAAQAWTSVTVLAQVSGKLLTVNFTEGTDVQKGQLLAQIDPAPYLAVLTQAQGTLERDRALLAWLAERGQVDRQHHRVLHAARRDAREVVPLLCVTKT